MLTLRSVFETLCLDPMSMDLVLLAFIVSLFLTDQLWILARAIFKIFSISLTLEELQVIVESSAYMNKLQFGGYKVEDH